MWFQGVCCACKEEIVTLIILNQPNQTFNFDTEFIPLDKVFFFFFF